MKILVTTRFKGDENKAEIEALCDAVRASGHTDFNFVRDIENYRKTFDDPRELWKRARLEVKNCDALLLDISDNPTGGRLLEAGMAYALGKPVIIIVKEALTYKEIFDGIATAIIRYNSYSDIVPELIKISL